MFVSAISEFDHSLSRSIFGSKELKSRRTAFAWSWENTMDRGVSAIGESRAQAEILVRQRELCGDVK